MSRNGVRVNRRQLETSTLDSQRAVLSTVRNVGMRPYTNGRRAWDSIVVNVFIIRYVYLRCGEVCRTGIRRDYKGYMAHDRSVE